MIFLEGEDVKQAVVERLLEVFPNVAVYKEAVTNVAYPHFFVNQVTLIDLEERKNVHLLHYSIEIRYRITPDSSTDLTLQRDLDNIGLKLLQSFDIIDLEDEKVRCTDKSIEKNDGVLFFYFGVQIMARKVVTDNSELQRKLTITMELSEV